MPKSKHRKNHKKKSAHRTKMLKQKQHKQQVELFNKMNQMRMEALKNKAEQDKNEEIVEDLDVDVDVDVDVDNILENTETEKK